MKIYYSSYHKYSIIGLFCLLLIYVVYTPIILFPDSYGYLNMDIYRSASYPLFLNLVKSIFGSLFETAIKIIQFFFGAFAIFFFVKNLYRNLNIKQSWCLGLSIILFIPYFLNHKIANAILSEALSYPLYLITVSYFISSFLNEKTKYLWYALPFIFWLIETRSQFLFIVPIGIIVLIWIVLKTKTFKKNSWLFLVLLCLPILTSITDKIYHKVKHNYYVNTPWTGIAIISPTLYVSDKEDYQLFHTENEKKFYKKTFQLLSEKKLNINYIDSTVTRNTIDHYVHNFAEICNFTALEVGRCLFPSNYSYNQKLIAVDKLTKKMTIPLILDNFKQWLSLYIKNIIHGIGSLEHLLFYIIALFFGIYKLKTEPSNAIKVIVLSIAFLLSNISLVALGMHTIKRFTFYNDWVLFLNLFILLNSFNHSKKEHNGY